MNISVLKIDTLTQDIGQVGVTKLASDRALVCVSAWEVAERFEAALVGRLDVDLNVFLSKVQTLIAMVEGILKWMETKYVFSSQPHQERVSGVSKPLPSSTAQERLAGCHLQNRRLGLMRRGWACRERC